MLKDYSLSLAMSLLITYGDGVADIDLNALLDFHRNHGKMVTVTAVRPAARFGELKLVARGIEFQRETPAA